MELIGTNAIRLEFPKKIRAHNVVQVKRTTYFYQQTYDKAAIYLAKAIQFINFTGEKLLKSRKSLRIGDAEKVTSS